MSARSSVGGRLYRALLGLFPASFRHEYGEEMEIVFRDRRRRADGVAASVALWLETVPDVVVSAGRVHADVLRQDLRYSLRSLSRAPVFAATVVTVLALGIGASTAVFSLADRVFWRPLPYEEPHRLVRLWENVPSYSRMEPSPANFRDWSEMTTVFEGVAPYHAESVNWVGEAEPLQVAATRAGGGLMPLLGVEPLFGRVLEPRDEEPGAPLTAVLSHDFWQGAFGGTPDVLGRSLRLDDEAYTVVGVMPSAFRFPDRDTALWIPKRFTEVDFEDRDDNYLKVVARLGDGSDLDAARLEMEVVTERLERQHPEANRDTRASVVPLRDDVPRSSRLLVKGLAAASVCLLVIALTNLANLLLARSLARAGETSLRLTLGSGRERLVRQRVTELALLGGAGWLAGLGVAWASLPLLSRLVPLRLPVEEASGLDPRVFAFATLLAALTVLVFGVAPVFGGRAVPLREGARSGFGGRRHRLRAALVVAQVGGTVVLLVASGLLVRALWQVRAVDPGFTTDGVFAVHTPLPYSRYELTERRAELYRRVLEDVRRAPGVEEASFVSFLPMVMGGGIWPVTLPGNPDTERRRTASLRFATPRFFSTLGVPLRQGRDFDDGDDEDAPDVAIVSESFAERYWPSESPIGQRFEFAFRERTVVGVVGNVRVRGLESPSEPQVYLPHGQVPDGGLWFYAPKELVVRLRPDAPMEPVSGAIRGTLRSADAELPIPSMRSLESVVAAETATRSTQLAVLALFATVSLLLSAIGIYGLVGYAVAERRPELGVRMALGAGSADILWMVVRQAVRLAVLGALVGGVLGYGFARMLGTLLAGVDPGDPITYAIAAAVALSMAVLGSIGPALRATQIDPVEATR